MLALGSFSIYKEYNEQICGNYKIIFKYFYYFYLCVCVFVGILHVRACADIRRGLQLLPLELEIQTTVSLHAGAGDY